MTFAMLLKAPLAISIRLFISPSHFPLSVIKCQRYINFLTCSIALPSIPAHSCLEYCTRYCAFVSANSLICYLMFTKNMDIDECGVHAIELYAAGFDTVSNLCLN